MPHLKYPVALSAFIMILLLNACIMGEDCVECYFEDPEPMTTMLLKIVASGTSDTVTYRFYDPDGTDTQTSAPMDTIYLLNNMSYRADIFLYDETASPIVDVTKEIRAERKEHCFFFINGNELSLNVSYLDSDQDGQPVGLASQWNVGNASEDTLFINLRHLTVYKDGNPNNGEADMNAHFFVKVQ